MTDRTEPPDPAPRGAPLAAAGGVPSSQSPASDEHGGLSDGEWHRLHPLSPLFRGGIVLVVAIGIVIANMRDRLVTIFLPGLVPEGTEVGEWSSGDPVDFVLDNGLLLIATLVFLGVLIVLVAGFYLSWRFHTFRITDDDVEVVRGVLFRSQRRAPLDRVQGVNLTRPLVARLVGLAKLEVVGAGADANVKLDYLSTRDAERVRADILQLASGRQLAPSSAGAGTRATATRSRAVSDAVSAGITGLIVGAEGPASEPESIVHIPAARLIAAQVLSGSTVALLVMAGAAIAGGIWGSPWVLLGLVPALLGFGAYWVSQIVKSLRYSIAPTHHGLRVTFGLFTTITEIIPPGRVHAVEVRQSIFWRPFGWWVIKINRLTGRSAGDTTTDQFTTVLPVGTRADVERVLRLVLPGTTDAEWSVLFQHGILGPGAADPFSQTPQRAWFIRPLSWKRNGFLVSPDALVLRRGQVWRSLAIFPFARMQSLGLHQGPVDRAVRVASLRPHTVAGPVYGYVAALDRDAALAAFADVSARATAAATADRSHRWAQPGPAS